MGKEVRAYGKKVRLTEPALELSNELHYIPLNESMLEGSVHLFLTRLHLYGCTG